MDEAVPTEARVVRRPARGKVMIARVVTDEEVTGGCSACSAWTFK
jgi:hypothetical protein